MIIPVNKELEKKILGDVIYLGSEPRYRYDNDKGEYTDEIVSNSVNLGCSKLEDSINVIVSTPAHVEIEKFAPVNFVELEYDPSATGNSFNTADGQQRVFGRINERFRCKWVEQNGKPVFGNAAAPRTGLPPVGEPGKASDKKL